ncbi:Rdp1: RNA-directed DNA polymerase (reverse transcriptase) [Desulfosarcina variabilis str. Montpellier]|uniref:reverse transcriptase domain-containing protein n=1 Tax=Desulfosarcina variabilis TaxID=2300 RepID=UPI003AFADFB5
MIRHILSTENFIAGFERVEASQGMAGVDGVTIREFKSGLEINLRQLVFEIKSNTYHPLPLLRFEVAKKDGNPRPLAVPAVRDRVAQAAVLNIIQPILEKAFEDVSHAYRKGRSVKTAARQIKKLRDKGYRFVVEVDLDAYFDNIDHMLLEDKLRHHIKDDAVVGLLRRWIRNEVYDGRKIYIPEKGIPQGSVVSPVLANLFLDDFDEEMIRRGYQLVRYSDDFIILAKSASEARDALELTDKVMALHHLSLDDEDTGITDFEKGFKYLGLTFIGDSIMVPFDRAPATKKILYMPPPLDLKRYLANRKSVTAGQPQRPNP